MPEGLNAEGRGSVVSRAMAAWGAVVTVVLAAVSAFLTNQLNGGWPWWVAAAGVVAVSAAVSGWLAWRGSGGGSTGPGRVRAGRDVRGRVRTRIREARFGGTSSAGSVAAGRDIDGGVSTDVEF